MSMGYNLRNAIIQQPTNLMNGNTLYVGGNGPNNYTRIKSAINNAENGDTIFIYNGIYFEYDIYIQKSITIIGENNTNTVVNGYEGEKHTFITLSDNVIIKNFTIKGLNSSPFGIGDACICIQSEYNIIENMILTDANSGILVSGKDHTNNGPNLISNCIFLENYVGVFLYFTRECTINNCFFTKHNEGAWGIYLNDAFHCKILNSNFTGGRYIFTADANYNLIENCNFFNYTIQFNGDTDGNIIRNCFFDSPNKYDCIEFYFPGKDNIVENCIIKNSMSFGIFITETQNNLRIINCTFDSVGKDAIHFSTNIYRSTISGCKFLNNGNAGIYTYLAVRYLDVNNCHFEGNRYGIITNVVRNLFNKFSYNNFMNKDKNILFEKDYVFNIILNKYQGNYWDDYKGYGFHHLYGLFNWDFKPAMEPYDIEV